MQNKQGPVIAQATFWVNIRKTMDVFYFALSVVIGNFLGIIATHIFTYWWCDTKKKQLCFRNNITC